jgi:hypothetical protein
LNSARIYFTLSRYRSIFFYNLSIVWLAVSSLFSFYFSKALFLKILRKFSTKILRKFSTKILRKFSTKILRKFSTKILRKFSQKTFTLIFNHVGHVASP